MDLLLTIVMAIMTGLLIGILLNIWLNRREDRQYTKAIAKAISRYMIKFSLGNNFVVEFNDNTGYNEVKLDHVVIVKCIDIKIATQWCLFLNFMASKADGVVNDQIIFNSTDTAHVDADMVRLYDSKDRPTYDITCGHLSAEIAAQLNDLAKMMETGENIR